MYLEVAAPASLPMGLLHYAGKTCLLALTVQHPPVHIYAADAQKLQVTGGRAHVGVIQAEQFLRANQKPQRAEIEIELTIPAFMGLGSDGQQGLAIARALAAIHDLPVEDTPFLGRSLGLQKQHLAEIWGFDRGGVLLLDMDAPVGHEVAVLRRLEIAHIDRESWALVFHLPDMPLDTPDSWEADHFARALEAIPQLDPQAGDEIGSAVFAAIEQDDIQAFGEALNRLAEMNQAASLAAGQPRTWTDTEEMVLQTMRENGALAWGRSLTGGCLYGLVRGGDASRVLRSALIKQLGYFAGTTMATIIDNRGASHLRQKGNLRTKETDRLRILEED